MVKDQYYKHWLAQFFDHSLDSEPEYKEGIKTNQHILNSILCREVDVDQQSIQDSNQDQDSNQMAQSLQIVVAKAWNYILACT